MSPDPSSLSTWKGRDQTTQYCTAGNFKGTKFWQSANFGKNSEHMSLSMCEMVDLIWQMMTNLPKFEMSLKWFTLGHMHT